MDDVEAAQEKHTVSLEEKLISSVRSTIGRLLEGRIFRILQVEAKGSKAEVARVPDFGLFDCLIKRRNESQTVAPGEFAHFMQSISEEIVSCEIKSGPAKHAWLRSGAQLFIVHTPQRLDGVYVFLNTQIQAIANTQITCRSWSRKLGEPDRGHPWVSADAWFWPVHELKDLLTAIISGGSLSRGAYHSPQKLRTRLQVFPIGASLFAKDTQAFSYSRVATLSKWLSGDPTLHDRMRLDFPDTLPIGGDLILWVDGVSYVIQHKSHASPQCEWWRSDNYFHFAIEQDATSIKVSPRSNMTKTHRNGGAPPAWKDKSMTLETTIYLNKRSDAIQVRKLVQKFGLEARKKQLEDISTLGKKVTKDVLEEYVEGTTTDSQEEDFGNADQSEENKDDDENKGPSNTSIQTTSIPFRLRRLAQRIETLYNKIAAKEQKNWCIYLRNTMHHPISAIIILFEWDEKQKEDYQINQTPPVSLTPESIDSLKYWCVPLHFAFRKAIGLNQSLTSRTFPMRAANMEVPVYDCNYLLIAAGEEPDVQWNPLTLLLVPSEDIEYPDKALLKQARLDARAFSPLFHKIIYGPDVGFPTSQTSSTMLSADVLIDCCWYTLNSIHSKLQGSSVNESDPGRMRETLVGLEGSSKKQIDLSNYALQLREVHSLFVNMGPGLKHGGGKTQRDDEKEQDEETLCKDEKQAGEKTPRKNEKDAGGKAHREKGGVTDQGSQISGNSKPSRLNRKGKDKAAKLSLPISIPILGKPCADSRRDFNSSNKPPYPIFRLNGGKPVDLINPKAREQVISASATGLRNGGNTCYQNAVIQALMATDAFTSKIAAIWNDPTSREALPDMQKNFIDLIMKLKDSRYADSLANLTQLWTHIQHHANTHDQPNPAADFVKGNSTQQDAAEWFFYLEKFLCPDQLMQSVFPLMTTRVRIQCTECEAFRYMEGKETSRTVVVPIPASGGKLQDLIPFNKWSDVEGGAVNHICHHFSGQQSRSELRGWPQNIIVQLARYDKSDPRYKNIARVDYPELPWPLAGTGEKFVVRAVVCHSGIGTDSGHYYTITRDKDPDYPEWTIWNDSERTTTTDLAKAISPDAYLLFLEKTS